MKKSIVEAEDGVYILSRLPESHGKFSFVRRDGGPVYLEDPLVHQEISELIKRPQFLGEAAFDKFGIELYQYPDNRRIAVTLVPLQKIEEQAEPVLRQRPQLVKKRFPVGVNKK